MVGFAIGRVGEVGEVSDFCLPSLLKTLVYHPLA